VLDVSLCRQSIKRIGCRLWRKTVLACDERREKAFQAGMLQIRNCFLAPMGVQMVAFPAFHNEGETVPHTRIGLHEIPVWCLVVALEASQKHFLRNAIGCPVEMQSVCDGHFDVGEDAFVAVRKATIQKSLSETLQNEGVTVEKRSIEIPCYVGDHIGILSNTGGCFQPPRSITQGDSVRA